MKKYIFLFIGLLIILSAFRLVVGVDQSLTGYSFFTILSEVNMTPDPIIDLFFQLRDDLADILNAVTSTRIPGSDAWSSGDYDILSFLKLIGEILVDFITFVFCLVPILFKLIVFLISFLREIFNYLFEIFKFLLRLLGIWHLRDA